MITTQRVAALFHIQLQEHGPVASGTLIPPPLLCRLLDKYSHLFQTPALFSPSQPTDHNIHLEPNSKPVNVRPYRYPYYQKQEIKRQGEDMLRCQLIRPIHNLYSSRVLLVKKKDETWRFCVDYRALNKITIKDRFALPTIDEILDDLGRSSWFLKLDLAQGFHQIRMVEHDVPKMAFRTHQGHYEYVVMPFGLCNPPSTFQATMKNLFRLFIRKFVMVFFDDILIYSRNFQAHLEHLDCVLQTLQQCISSKIIQLCFRSTTHWISRPLCLFPGSRAWPFQDSSHTAMASFVISQTIAQVLGLDWILSVLRQALCPNCRATYPFITEGSIRMVFRGSIRLWQFETSIDHHVSVITTKFQCFFCRRDRHIRIRHGSRVDAARSSNCFLQQAILYQTALFLDIHPRVARYHHRCENMTSIPFGPCFCHSH